MKHQEIRALTDSERVGLTDDERAFLDDIAAMDAEVRDMFLTAFGLSIRAKTDAEAVQAMEDFRQWLARRQVKETPENGEALPIEPGLICQ